jgi:NAD-dependent SIR2 family protein deacetylase
VPVLSVPGGVKPEKKEAKSDRASSKASSHKNGSKLGKPVVCGVDPVKAGALRDLAKAAPKASNLRQAESSALPELQRPNVCACLADKPFLQHTDPLFMHGRLYDGPMRTPNCIWDCKKPPRDDHSAPKWLTASEFQDDEAVALHKVRQLAALMRISKKTVLYTGAGISASVIGQAARSGQNKQGWKSDTRAAKPTPTHCALGLLGQQGLIHGWVQQNHDGLPQKAGFPQENINEIHGSWYDPSNPVVKYSGSLHDRAFPWMEEDAETADLVIVLGTSLGGLNADQVATNAAERSVVSRAGALGTVCINLQQTEQDGIMTLRLFGKSDHLTGLLLRELGFSSARQRPQVWTRENRALVPYDADGRRLPKGERRWMWLDLSERQKIRITPGHNIQGAKQPMFMHIGGRKPITTNGVTRQPGVGLGSVVSRNEDTACFVLDVEGVQMRLGIWWLEAALRGGPDVLPIVNQRPIFESVKSS